ncbi:MAG TPA: hypothetical protein VFW02_01545 [Candidatus Limnocylindrales bacterium]|nr:hypothetical protein [Candidatus Limnocylindrales bacterium]
MPALVRQSWGYVLMFDFRHLTRLTALAVATGLIAAACSSGSSSPSAAPTAEASVAPSVEAPSTAPSEAPASEAPAASIGTLPSFDLSALTGGLPGVDSYRTETSVGGVKQYESVVVTKPVLSKAITMYEGGDVSQRFVVIGNEVWTAQGTDGAFEADTTGIASTMLMALDPALMLGAYASVDWAGAAANQGVEDKNGVQAHHLRIDSTTFVGAAAQMPAGSAIDIWVADAGYLVAWEMTGFPEDANFAIEVTGVNDPANKVERPD